MANIVEIVIRGKDQSAAGIRQASDNIATLDKQSKALGRGFSELGQISSALGSKHLAGLASQSAGLIQVAESMALVFQKVTARALAIGAAVAAAGFLINKYIEMKEEAKKAEEANKELAKSIEDMQLQNLRLSKSDALEAKEAEVRHKRRIEQLVELLNAGADSAQIEEALRQSKLILEKEFNAAKLTNYEKYKQEMKLLDDQYNAGEIEAYIKNLNDGTGALAADMEGRKALLTSYRDFWIESHRTMFSYVAEGTKTIATGLTNSLTNVILHTQSAAEAFKELGLSIAKMFLTWVLNRTIAFVAEKVLSAVGIALAHSQAAAISVVAAGVAAAWAPAATASLIATYGSSAGAAGLLVPAMALNQAAAASLSLAGGVAHGGANYIPEESTYLLQEGERVLSPNQNEDFTSFIRSGGGGRQGFNIDGRRLGEELYAMSKDGRLRIDGRAIS